MGTVKIKSRIRKVSTTCRRHEWSRTESCTWPAMSEVVTIGQGTIWYQVHRIFTWYRPPTVPSGSFVSDSILDVHAVLSSANSTQLQQVQIMLADKRYRGRCQRPPICMPRDHDRNIYGLAGTCWCITVPAFHVELATTLSGLFGGLRSLIPALSHPLTCKLRAKFAELLAGPPASRSWGRPSALQSPKAQT